MTPERIRQIRLAAGHTQESFAAMLRLSSRKTVIRWEQGALPVTGPAEILLELLEAGKLPKGYQRGRS